MEGFRVLLDLGDFFSDYRSKSWVYIDPEKFKHIQSFKDHVSQVFSIVEDFDIFLSGSYVPNTECIKIIVEGDVLQLQRSDHPHDGIVVLREAPICMQNNDDKTREDDEVIPEKKKKKKSKKRKNVNDIEKCVKDSSEVMEMPSLQEDFHPDYNSTMTPPKKRKFLHHSAELKDFQESSSLEDKMDLSKKKPIKKVKRVRETIEMVENSEAASHCNEEESVNSPCMDINEKSHSSRGNENDSVIIKLSKSGHGDLTMKSDTIDLSNISEIVGDTGSNALLSQHSLSRNSLLEHTIYNGVPHMFDDVTETLKTASVPKKRKRNRIRKKKRKGLVYLSTSFSQEEPLQYILPHSASPCEKSAATWHLRFSDSDEERILSTHEIAEGSKETTLNGVNENRSISVDSQGKNLTGSVEKETVTEPEKKNVKMQCDVEVDSIKDVCRIKMIDQQEVNEVNTLSIKNVGEKSNDEHNSGEIESDVKEETSEVASLKTKKNTTNRYVRKARKAVISTGLGETLAHLMKEVKTVDNDEALKKLCPPKPIKADVEPPMLIINNQAVQRNKKDKRYKSFPILEKYPRKGDILAFKILKLNECYEPCISDYIEGTVTVCDEDQSRLEVKILEGASEFEKRSGKFDLQFEEDADDTKERNKIDDNILNLQWKDFIEPRLIFP